AAVGLASALFLPSMGLGQVVIYPSAPDTQLSAAYSLTINGHSVAVEKYGPISIARFAFAGPAEIEVTVCQPVNSFDLIPKSAFAGSSANGNTIAFKLANPQKLVLRRVNS